MEVVVYVTSSFLLDVSCRIQKTDPSKSSHMQNHSPDTSNNSIIRPFFILDGGRGVLHPTVSLVRPCVCLSYRG